MLFTLPLLVALAVLVPVGLSPFSRRVRLPLTRVALAAFGTYVTERDPRRERQRTVMRAAHVGGTHRAYASRTLLFSTLFGLAGSILGVYVTALILWLLSMNVETLTEVLPAWLAFLTVLARISELGLGRLFLLLLGSGATIGVGLSAGAYWLRWRYLDHLAEVRAGKINASLPRTVAFTYALSRSGMSFPKVLRTLTRNEAVYGEAAAEVNVAVRDMDTFGTDVLTALRQLSTRTPSQDLEEFSENLASVLGSGRNLSAFLRSQYERYQREAESLQEQYLELLSAFAEIYVTVLVAGPLFLITVLVIVGLVLQDTMILLALITYVAIPAGTAVFVASLDDAVHRVGSSDTSGEDGTQRGDAAPAVSDGAALGDGGTVTSAREVRNRERLAAYDRFGVVRRWLRSPVESVVATPEVALIVVLPAALAWFLLRVQSIGTDPAGIVALVDGPLIESAILVLGASALVYEFRKRRLDAIDDAIPDFLDRLASVNEAGLTVVESIKRVSKGDLGALGPEIQRTCDDIEWGATAEEALRRLDRRTGTPMMSRSVTLVTNAMTASGEVAPVLRIAASEAQNSRRLRRERKQEMLTYMLVIYISFFVFLGIVAALSIAFIPAIERAGGQMTNVGGGAVPVDTPTDGIFAGLGSVNTAAYERLFFHVTAVQAVCSGAIAGQLGEGRLSDGLKHATVLLATAYLAFAFV